MRPDSTSSDHQDRRDAAIDWWTRLDAGGLSRKERAAFGAWLAEDKANQAAFDACCRVWGELKGLPRTAVAANFSSDARAARRVWRFAFPALAAAALLLVFTFDELWILWRADISTGAGEVKIVTLEDASRVQLDASTALTKDFSGPQRRLTLLNGEAWFDAAPNPARPFIVEAAGGATTALGTSFDIATGRGMTEVTVTSHRVSVAATGETTMVQEGQQTAYGPGFALLAPHPIDADSVTAWRRGRLIFQDKPLGEVIAILNRYHRGLIWAAPSIRDRIVTGVFHASDPLQSIRAIEKSLGLNAIYLSNYFILLRG